MGIYVASYHSQNLWPENPPILYLALEGLLTSLSMFGPVIASLIVLKIKGFKAICSFYLLKQERNLALSPTLQWKSGSDFCISFRRQAGRRSSAFIYWILYLPYDLGWWHGRAWLARLSAPALEKKFSMLIASSITGLAWACWHIPLWFYDRFYDRSQNPFLVYIIVTIVQSIWFAALHKKTKSVLACMVFHALLDILIETFVGINLADKFDFSQVNSLIYLGGLGILTLYSIYLWYRADKEEKNA